MYWAKKSCSDATLSTTTAASRTNPGLLCYEPTYNHLLYYAVVTQHIKQLYYYNWLHSTTCFGVTRPSSGQQGIVLIKVHSLAFSNGIPLFTLKILKLMRPVFMVKMLLDLKYKIYNFF